LFDDDVPIFIFADGHVVVLACVLTWRLHCYQAFCRRSCICKRKDEFADTFFFLAVIRHTPRSNTALGMSYAPEKRLLDAAVEVQS